VAGQCPVAFSPDGKWLATGGGGVRLWEVGTWRPGALVSRPNEICFAFSEDGRLLAVQGDPGVVRLVVPETGKELVRLTGPVDTPLYPRCFTPDRTRLIAVGGDLAIHIFDLAAVRRQLREIGLDWDPPLQLPAAADSGRPRPLQVEVDRGNLAAPKPEEKARQTIARYRRVLEGKPDDKAAADACNALAWVYATGPEAVRDLKKALPLAEKAARLAPDDANIRNTLGVVYYRVGRYRDAVETLQANLPKQDDPSLGYDLYFLAMSHHQLGETAAARLYYDWATRWPLPPGINAADRAARAAELAAFRAEAAALLGRPDPGK
jgi:hypothetical protein